MLDSYPGCSLGSSQSQHTSNKHAWHISEGGFHPFHEAAPTTPTMNDSLIGKHPKSRALQFRNNFQDIRSAQQFFKKNPEPQKKTKKQVHPLIFVGFGVFFLVRFFNKGHGKNPRDFPDSKPPQPPKTHLP